MSKIDIYKVGMIVYGKISGIKPYGAFVTFENGVSGLIHISEISNGFVKNIDKYFKLNSYVVVKIIDVDKENNQLRLSFKTINQSKRKRNNLRYDQLPKHGKGFEVIKQAMPMWIKQYNKNNKGLI